MAESNAKLVTMRLRLGHHGPKLFLVTLVLLILSTIWNNNLWLKFATVLGLLVGLVGMLLFTFYHQKRLCLLCQRAQPFDNPEQAVKKYKSLLRLAHYETAWRIGGLVVICFALWGMAAPLLKADNRAVDLVTYTLAAIISVGGLYVDQIHSRLLVWCPFCKNGGCGHDDHEHPVTPDPRITKTPHQR